MVRYKKRYLVVELERVSHVCRDQLDLAPLDVTQLDVTNAVRDKVQELHGDHGRAAITIGLRVVYINPATRLLLIQVRHGPHRLAQSSVPFLTRVGRENVVPRLLYTGATIRHSYTFMERRQRQLLHRAIAEMGEENKKHVESAILEMNQI